MVPINIDVYTVIIFLGAVQGLFITFFFFRAQDASLSNTLLGLLVLTLSAFSIDIFLGYSGYMTRVLHLVDFTETLNFVLAPLFYLYVVVTLDRQHKLKPRQYLHFIPAALYALYFLLFFLQSTEYKYNAYIDAYYPELPRLDAPAKWHQDPLLIKANINLLQLLQYVIYLGLTVRHYVVWRKQTNRGPSPWIRGAIIGMIASFMILLAVKLYFERDFGEYILGSKTTLLIYALSFYMLNKSLFLKEPAVPSPTKYKKSSFPEDRAEQLIDRLQTLMTTEQPYLDPSFSLPTLATKLNLSTHHLSQLLNGHLNQSFHEFVASYRVDAAKALLARDVTQPIPIEYIAEQVGYYSKSSFNAMFKKQTGLTPSEFRKMTRKNAF